MMTPKPAFSLLRSLLAAVMLTAVLAAGAGRFHHHCCHGTICLKWSLLVSATHHHHHAHRCNDTTNQCAFSNSAGLCAAERIHAHKDSPIGVALMPDALFAVPEPHTAVSTIYVPAMACHRSYIPRFFTRRGPPEC